MNILGISAFYHDSAACLVRDGDIVAAAQEERFTRKKHDPGFPSHAISYCLHEGGIKLSDLNYIAFYDKPLLKFERLLETYMSFAPRGLRSFLMSMPLWLKEKLFLKKLLQDQFREIESAGTMPPILFGEHHESHAASAFYPSPYQEAAILCLDGVGEWATTTAWTGKGNGLTPLWEIPFPHSIGLLYSAFTYHTGFKVNSGEYKIMGLAPYGQPKYVQTIYDHVIDLKPDGTFRLNMDYFDYCTGLAMTNRRFDELFGSPPREPETRLTQREMDMARSVQDFTDEEIRAFLDERGAPYFTVSSDELCDRVAAELAAGKVIGWFQDRMEFGPRALGARSILGDARNTTMQSVMNLKIKFRESFRPFAPSVLRESVKDYFEMDTDSPYMLLVADVAKSRCLEMPRHASELWGIDLLNVPRSDIPAVTHIDYSARVQTVHEDTNPRYHRLLKTFEALTGCAVIVNTSFNVRGEPIVCTPEDAYRCFMRTEMDLLVLGNHLVYKVDQKPLETDADWRKEFVLD